jgi:DNA invertase Pin-like site-specific DNA recombinase
MKRTVAYCRVSTNSQDVSSQLLAIKEAIQTSGDALVKVYEDVGISGTQSRANRPALDQMLRDAKDGKFDKVVVYDLSRLGRSMSNLISTLQDLDQAGVDIHLLKNGIQTDSAGGRMLFGIFGSIAAWERELIVERVKSGIANARAKGVRLGRPSNCNPQTKATVLELRSKGMSIRKICSLLRIGVSKYYEFSREHEALAV